MYLFVIARHFCRSNPEYIMSSTGLLRYARNDVLPPPHIVTLTLGITENGVGGGGGANNKVIKIRSGLKSAP